MTKVLFYWLYFFVLTNCVLVIRCQYRGRDPHYDYDDYRAFDEPTTPKPKKQINPCHHSHHRVISDQPERSYNYRLGSGKHRERVLCDRELIPGWYRFQSSAGNTIPTSCPGVNYCGTRAPVWMKGTIPTLEEGITEASGCISVQGKCCTTQIPMLVRNCSDFIVYHLRPTPACPAAYCAGYEVPCPVGLSSDSGYTPCHFPVDLLETKVSIGMSKDSNQVHFFCDVTLGGHVVPESVALEVEWLADDETIQTETFGLLEQHKGVLKEDKWTIGQTLQCRARARHTSINTFTSVVTSPPFNTGVSISSSQTQTAYEGGEPAYIEVQTNIPVICPKKKKEPKNDKKKEEEEEEEEEECCVVFEVSTKGQNSPRCADGSVFDMVVLKSCTFKICGDEWNSTHKIPVWAINDGLVGGAADTDSDYSSVYIDIKTVEPSPAKWQDIILPTQEIVISHADAEEKCMADEFITTFDGVSYSNQLEGVFVLYRHTELPYEVQIQLKKCNQRPVCNCAVAIRFGDVMLAADICSTGRMKFWTYSSDGSYIEPQKISHLPQIIRIDEGRSFQVQFPSGTRINLGPNLRFISIQASTADVDHTSGLCGSLDRDSTNDFATFKGQIVCSASRNVTGPCDDFSKSWRLLSDQSLFSGTFNNDGYDFENEELVPEETSPGHCSCSALKKAGEVELRPKAKSKFSSYPYEEYQPEETPEEETEETKNKCSTIQCVDPRGADITIQLLDLLFDEDYAPEETELRNGADTAQLSPIYSAGSSSPLTLQTQLKKDWNEDEAEIFCLRMIEGVPISKLCRDIAQVDVDIHTKACKQDILFTKSPIWSVDALEQLRWECRDQVYHNLSIWEPQLGRRHGTPPLAILSSLCLNNCTGVGACENGNCRCPRGMAGADCSVDTNQAPRVTSLNHNGICDIRSKPCSEILIWGDRFATHSSLKCHFDIYRLTSVKSVPVLSGSVTTNGRLLTYQSIICDVPDLPIHDAKVASFYIPGEGLEKTKALVRVRVAYGSESPPSEPLDFTIFDSLCWECDRPLTCQARPTQSCNVLSEPFGSSSDPFQTSFNSPPAGFAHTSSPLQYSPDTSIAFTPSTIYQHGVSPVPGTQLQLHPQLSAPCMLEKETGPCRNDILRYFYDASARRCRPFIFGGCQGNANNFVSEQDCMAQCSSAEDPHHQQSIPGNAALSSEQLDQFMKSTTDPIDKIPKQCLLESNPGPCKDEVVRYYYDYTMSRCRPFIFGGCGGNANNYKTKEACSEECEAPENTQTQIISTPVTPL